MGNKSGFLMSFFIRDNLNGDPSIYEGFGPLRRRVHPTFKKDADGKWNFASPGDGRSSVMMPNPDTLIETLEKPVEGAEYDLVRDLTDRKNGWVWLDHCEEFLKGWRKRMPKELLFKIKLSKMPPLFYVHGRGADLSLGTSPILSLKTLPKKMLHGTFHPERFDPPSAPSGNGRINMHCIGGFLTPDNVRWNYNSQRSANRMYFSGRPIRHQLVGELRRDHLAYNSGRAPNYYFKGHEDEFPRTHFVEYIFGRKDMAEKNPSPAIRIEINPDFYTPTTLEREGMWERTMRKMEASL